MTNLEIVCFTIIAITLICNLCKSIEQCSFYKWKAHNPKAFELKEKEED